MRIERINENSIRCILTSFDLSVRNLNIRELAYGSEKARKLFQEMMTKASNEVGFDAENTPIMIEAIPMGGDSIQLVITKVDDPEELDTRFSKFSPGHEPRPIASEEWLKRLTNELLEGADGLFRQMQQLSAKSEATPAAPSMPQQMPQTDSGSGAQKTAPEARQAAERIAFRAYGFDDLDRVIEAAKAAHFFMGYSSLYKRPGSDAYVLVLKNSKQLSEDFARACNVIAEYGRKLTVSAGSLAYYDEHYQMISKDRAIQKLGNI